MDHIDFQIRAWKADKSHAQVMVHSSPVGDMSKPVTVPFRETQQQDFFAACESLFNISPSSNDSQLQRAIQMGRELSQIILPPPVLTLLLSSLAHISPETGLRLRLCLDNSLIDLPWEFLYRPDIDTEEKPDRKSLNGFLALDPRISFVRLSPATSLKIQPSTEKQRIVFATMTHGGEFVRGAEDEYKELSKALEPLKKFIKLEFITASLDNFNEVLAKPVAILHYSGATSEGFMALDARASDPSHQVLTSEKLSGMLRKEETRLVMLGADMSGRWIFVEPLIRAGIPVIIGTQGILSIESYPPFCQKLYSSLALGLSLDEAVTGARLHLLETLFSATKENYEWGAFMVYMSTTETVLFPKPEAATTVRKYQYAERQAHKKTITKVSRVIGKASAATRVLDKTALRKALVGAFTEGELKILCADVQQNIQDDGIELLVNLEVAGGETKEATILELIGYLDRRGVLDYLVSAALKERPKVSETVFRPRGIKGS